eukprot:scaffold212972_cov30-Tisochrysis_lutea.AAC.4
MCTRSSRVSGTARVHTHRAHYSGSGPPATRWCGGSSASTRRCARDTASRRGRWELSSGRCPWNRELDVSAGAQRRRASASHRSSPRSALCTPPAALHS